MIVSSGPNFRTCLVNLFNSCLINSQWPWTESRVLFIKKPSKPDYTDPSAYRPLCMSSHIGKVFERILNNRIKTFLMNNNLIDHEQEGFFPKKSTKRSLYRLKIEYEILTRDKKEAALINFDLQKAFDSVWHNGLLLKRWTAGIRGLLFKLLSKFLTCRVVKTRIDDVISHPFQPKQGVPHGSVLPPLFFMFCIADMLHNTSGIKFNYADDSQIIVITGNQSNTCLTVEKNLNAVENWCRTWRIQLNGTKTEIVPINLDVNIPVFKLRGEKCKINYETKIFELTVDDSFSFQRHSEKITARCKGRWKEMRSHCNKKWRLSRNTLVLLYKSLVLPT